MSSAAAKLDRPTRSRPCGQVVEHRVMIHRRFLSEAARNSPTSTNASGERLAIRNQNPYEADLTLTTPILEVNEC